MRKCFYCREPLCVRCLFLDREVEASLCAQCANVAPRVADDTVPKTTVSKKRVAAVVDGTAPKKIFNRAQRKECEGAGSCSRDTAIDFGRERKPFSKKSAELGAWRETDLDDDARGNAHGLGDASGANGSIAERTRHEDKAELATALTPGGAVASDRAPPIRPVLPITFPEGTPVPVNTKEGVRAWITSEAMQRELRAWVLASMRGDGLTRHVPTGHVDPSGLDVRDAMIVTTDGLVAELLVAMRSCQWANNKRAHELFEGKWLKAAVTALVSQARSTKLGILRRIGAHSEPVRLRMHRRLDPLCRAAAVFVAHLRTSSSAIDPPHAAFEGLATVGACVDALLNMPAEDRSRPGVRSAAGTQPCFGGVRVAAAVSARRLGTHESGGACARGRAPSSSRSCVHAGQGTKERPR
jgi:hypothetical protein